MAGGRMPLKPCRVSHRDWSQSTVAGAARLEGSAHDGHGEFEHGAVTCARMARGQPARRGASDSLSPSRVRAKSSKKWKALPTAAPFIS